MVTVTQSSSIRHSPQARQELKERLQRLDTESLNHKKQALEADIKNLRDELIQRQELLAFIDDLIEQKQQP